VRVDLGLRVEGEILVIPGSSVSQCCSRLPLCAYSPACACTTVGPSTSVNPFNFSRSYTHTPSTTTCIPYICLNFSHPILTSPRELQGEGTGAENLTKRYVGHISSKHLLYDHQSFSS
jgi:hypothetical protein